MYRKKPSLVEATQWFRNGDHPFDDSKPVDTAGSSSTLTEGKVVQFFRRLHIPGDRICQECGNVMHKHGIILDPNRNEETVHPGDYILTHKTHGHFYRRSAVEFEAMYELYDSESGEATELPPSIDFQDLQRRVEALEEAQPTPNEMIQ
jgi:hypothetical protein